MIKGEGCAYPRCSLHTIWCIEHQEIIKYACTAHIGFLLDKEINVVSFIGREGNDREPETTGGSYPENSQVG